MIPIEDNTVFILFRRGKKKHIKNLFRKGEIYLNTVDFIRNCDDNEERSDPNDSIFKRKFFGDGEIKFCEVGLDINEHGKAFKSTNTVMNFDNALKGNIFCLSGIYTKDLIDNEKVKDFNTSSFGDSLIIITNPKEFVKRVKNTLLELGFEKVQCCSVVYYPNDYSGPVGVFRKHIDFSHQNEFRFFVPNPKNTPIKIKIGSLKDIAVIKEKQFVKFYFTDERTKTFNLI